jgi:hypothetical protein
MTAAAAFTCCYSDWKLIRTRKIVQLVFEVPVEHADAAYQVLGGMPDNGAEIWCAIARLAAGTTEPPPAAAPERDEQERARAHPATEMPAPKHALDREHHGKRWDELTPCAQAGILSNDAAFIKFLRENHIRDGIKASDAADFIRQYCKVTSRVNILPATKAGEVWHNLVKEFRTWKLAAKVVP